MRKILFFLLLIQLPASGSAQTTTLVFQPDADCGKDAVLTSLLPDANYGNHPDFFATKWTNGGVPVAVRSLLNFDLSGIPAGTPVISATLDLFHYNSPFNVGHSTLSGPNDGALYRITGPWNESAVTWNTEPPFTTTDSVFVHVSSTATEDYSLDVTTLVQDMINDPANSYGFLFKENVEIHYRSLLFASSDMSDPAKHPRLTLVLDDSVAVTTPCVSVSIEPGDTTAVSPPGTVISAPEVNIFVPNVFSPNGDGRNDTYFITVAGVDDYTMEVFNRWGEKVSVITMEKPGWEGKNMKGKDCSDGTYYYILHVSAKGHEDRYCGYISILR